MNTLETGANEKNLSKVKNTKLLNKDRHFQGDSNSLTWLWSA